MSAQLLPCPHCGGEAHTPTAWLSHDGTLKPIPRCRDCGAEAPSIEAWNRRVPQPVNARLLELLKDVEPAIRYRSDALPKRVHTAIAEAEQGRAWTSERPAVPGWYWVDRRDGREPMAFYLATPDILGLPGEWRWSGPFAPPPVSGDKP